MKKFVSKNIVDINNSPYKGFSTEDWILKYIECYGQIDGSHHKAWLLDQIARILNGVKVIVTLSEWSDGTKEYGFSTSSNLTMEYKDWVREMLGYDEEIKECEYTYDSGIAP